MFTCLEELDGPAVSALDVRSRKLSNVGQSSVGVTKNLLYRAPPCFERYVKSLVSAAFAVVSGLWMDG
jgi:hypothetical protein